MSKNSLCLRELGSYHLGGHIAKVQGKASLQLSPVPGSPAITVDPNGSFPVGQMYVQYARLASPIASYPLLMWHGGGMTGACWESTPDGRSGWKNFFLGAGLDVVVSDAVERGRSGWARFPDIYSGEPFFMPQHSAWALYRVGPPAGFSEEGPRTGFAGGLFPVKAFDAFTRQIVPRWSSNDQLIKASYDQLIEREGPCILLAHSQGAGFALRAAVAAPDRVKGLVLVEPGGAPELDSGAFAALAGIPVLTLWGDHVDAVPFWTAARSTSVRIAQGITNAGGDATVVDLPAQGIKGNSHLLMMDVNSDDVAAFVQSWLQRRNLLGGK